MVMRVAAALDVTLVLSPPDRLRIDMQESVDDEPIDLEAHLKQFDQ